MRLLIKNITCIFYFLLLLTGIIFSQIEHPQSDTIQNKFYINLNKDTYQKHNPCQNDSNTTLIGHWSNSPYCYAVDVSDDIACIGDSDSLKIINISDLANPLVLGNVVIPDIIWGIEIYNNKAYLADNSGGLRIINISDPTNPIEIGFFTTNGSARDVALSGNYAFVADNSGGLHIIDISNPTNPLHTGAFNFSGYARDVSIRGDFAYVANGSEGLRIINIFDPSNPYETGIFNTSGYAEGVAVNGNYAYVADSWGGLSIIDISNPSNPVEISYYDTGHRSYDVSVQDDYAYVADGHSGLRIIDISNPSNPIERGYFDTDDWAKCVTVIGNIAFVADGSDGVYIIRNDLVVSIEHNSIPVIQNQYLMQNFPNPFNPSTKINYTLPHKALVKIEIFNFLGQSIEILQNKHMLAGLHEIEFNAKDLPSGVYLYRIEAGEFHEVKKMILLR